MNWTQVPPDQELPGLVEETEAVARCAIRAGLERSTGGRYQGTQEAPEPMWGIREDFLEEVAAWS